jgi:hypothetical protein
MVRISYLLVKQLSCMKIEDNMFPITASRTTLYVFVHIASARSESLRPQYDRHEVRPPGYALSRLQARPSHVPNTPLHRGPPCMCSFTSRPPGPTTSVRNTIGIKSAHPDTHYARLQARPSHVRLPVRPTRGLPRHSTVVFLLNRPPGLNTSAPEP